LPAVYQLTLKEQLISTYIQLIKAAQFRTIQLTVSSIKSKLGNVSKLLKSMKNAEFFGRMQMLHSHNSLVSSNCYKVDTLPHGTKYCHLAIPNWMYYRLFFFPLPKPQRENFAKIKQQLLWIQQVNSYLLKAK